MKCKIKAVSYALCYTGHQRMDSVDCSSLLEKSDDGFISREGHQIKLTMPLTHFEKMLFLPSGTGILYRPFHRSSTAEECKVGTDYGPALKFPMIKMYHMPSFYSGLNLMSQPWIIVPLRNTKFIHMT